MKRGIYVPLLIVGILSSCETEQARKERLFKAEQEQLEWRKQKEKNDEQMALTTELERLKQERLEIEHLKEQETYDRFINNSLSTGSTPYIKYYGDNSICSDYECSEIRVKTPENSDVLVIVKQNEKVLRHAYIQTGENYTFSIPNGTYQVFFYYGKGWNPGKEMKGGAIKGGFISDESFGKDSPQQLNNNILEYELILQKNGNFSTKSSNQEEAL